MGVLFANNFKEDFMFFPKNNAGLVLYYLVYLQVHSATKICRTFSHFYIVITNLYFAKNNLFGAIPFLARYHP